MDAYSREQLLSLPLWALHPMALIARELREENLTKTIERCLERKRALGANSVAMIDSFPTDKAREERKALPTHADCSPLGEDTVAAMLMPGSALAKHMGVYESRPGQIEMARAVASSFNRATHLLAEAGTGIGKSLAYLVPAALWARLNDVPVVVSTNTRNLQSQLIEKDVPLTRLAVEQAMRGADDAQLRVALLKGRSNYLCLRRLAWLLENYPLELDIGEKREFMSALAWLPSTKDGDLESCAVSGRTSPLFLSRLASNGEECPGRACRYYRRCFLHKARNRAAKAHVVVANHALVFSDALSSGSTLPDYNQIVFDEAHNLEETATTHLSIVVGPARLNQIMRRLNRGRGRRSGGLLKVLRNQLDKGGIKGSDAEIAALKKEVARIGRSLEDVRVAAIPVFERAQMLSGKTPDDPVRYRCQAPETDGENNNTPTPSPPAAPMREISVKGRFVPCGDHWDETAWQKEKESLERVITWASDRMRELAESLRELTRDELSLYEDQALALDSAVASLTDFMNDLDFVFYARSNDYVFWASPPNNRQGLGDIVAAPLEIGKQLTERIFSKKESVVFCSATLRVGSSFNYLRRQLGLDSIASGKVDTSVAQSPFDYINQCAVMAPLFLPDPTKDEGYTQALTQLMGDVFVSTRGRAMGLFTSYEMMNQVARTLQPRLAQEGIALLTQSQRGSRDHITHQFRQGQASVLLGTHSFWEGVDVTGEALSCVVIARLPFGVVTDPVLEARCERIEAGGGSSFRELYLPQAVIRFRQGFGRLIRTRSDKGVVIVADPRVATKSYGSIFARSLPCPLRKVPDYATMLQQIKMIL